MTAEDQPLRNQLVALLKGGEAHASLDHALEAFPLDRAAERPHGLPYSAWQLVEHMRITLNDLLQFSTNSKYEELNWPGGYWPKDAAPPAPEAWDRTVSAIHADLQAFERLLHDPKSNLYAAIPWGKNQETLLREVLLAADHTAYHTGELIVLRRLLGAWKQ